MKNRIMNQFIVAAVLGLSLSSLMAPPASAGRGVEGEVGYYSSSAPDAVAAVNEFAKLVGNAAGFKDHDEFIDKTKVSDELRLKTTIKLVYVREFGTKVESLLKIDR